MVEPSTVGESRLPATRARQGSRGRHLLVVLVISSLLAALGMFIALAFTPLSWKGGAGARQETPAAAMVSDETPASTSTPSEVIAP